MAWASPYAHSEVVRRISAYSVTAGVTVMVPNSLGPGELLMQFGTPAQRDYWLPRLADGREIPCFGLTSPEAGSDAASMTDTGVVCRQVVDGRELIGIRLNWHKRYITLGPVATVLGLAFKLSDPDGILGEPRDIGISVALVPVDAPGVEIGRRHLPAMQAFQNGPNRGRDVFVPLDALIGGEERAGHGWQMLMSALAAGRGISLPSLSAAAAALGAHATGMYARVREQFGLPVGRFEGVQEKLANLAGNAYLVEAARRLTCAALNQGVKPAVVSGIMKYHATERMRQSVNDAMDVHAGRGVIDGPRNYLFAVPRRAHRHHGRRRQHPDAQPDHLRPGRHPRASVPDARDAGAGQSGRRARHGGLPRRVLASSAACRHDVPARHRAGLDRRHAGAHAHIGADGPPLPQAGPLRRRLRAAGRRLAGQPGRRAQAPRAALRKIGRHSVRAVSVVGRAQALGRRRPQARRPAAGALVHGAGRGSHRGAMDQVLSNLPGRVLAWGLRAAILPLRLAKGRTTP